MNNSVAVTLETGSVVNVDVHVRPATGHDLQVHDTRRAQGRDVLFGQSICLAPSYGSRS